MRTKTWFETARLCSSRNGARIVPSRTGNVSRISVCFAEEGGPRLREPWSPASGEWPWSEAGLAKGTPTPPTGPLGVSGGVGFPGTGLWWLNGTMFDLLAEEETPLVLLLLLLLFRGETLGSSVCSGDEFCCCWGWPCCCWSCCCCCCCCIMF